MIDLERGFAEVRGQRQGGRGGHGGGASVGIGAGVADVGARRRGGSASIAGGIDSGRRSIT